MIQNFEMWIYRGAIMLLLSILWYLAKGVLKELRLIRDALQGLHLSQVNQDDRIGSLEECTEKHEDRLNSHADKIRAIERNQDQCPSCPKS